MKTTIAVLKNSSKHTYMYYYQPELLTASRSWYLHLVSTHPEVGEVAIQVTQLHFLQVMKFPLLPGR